MVERLPGRGDAEFGFQRQCIVGSRRNARRHPGWIENAFALDDMTGFHTRGMDDEIAVGLLQEWLVGTLAPRVLRVDPAVEALDKLFIRDDRFRNFSADAADDDAMHVSVRPIRRRCGLHVGAETLRRNTFLTRPVYASLNQRFRPA